MAVVRKILHLDMDCFYAAVEVRENPQLRGKALGIGGPPNSRSVLTTASYEARKYGLHSAMPSSQAVRLCPHLILIPPRISFYREESRKVFRIFQDYTDRIEPLSLDEAFLDVTDTAGEGGATAIAREISRRVSDELGLTVSAGVAPNKFLAKIASDWKKPNGLFVLPPEKVEAFMPTLPINKIFGVGKVTAQKFNDLGFFTCGDLQKLPLWEMKRLFGSRAMDLYQLCRGEDKREVDSRSERKSFTVEETYSRDIPDFLSAQQAIHDLFKDWKLRFEKRDFVPLIDGMMVKLKFNDFQSTTHERKVAGMPVLEQFQQLFRSAWSRSDKPVRLLGLGVRLATPTERPPQLRLFES